MSENNADQQLQAGDDNVMGLEYGSVGSGKHHVSRRYKVCIIGLMLLGLGYIICEELYLFIDLTLYFIEMNKTGFPIHKHINMLGFCVGFALSCISFAASVFLCFALHSRMRFVVRALAILLLFRFFYNNYYSFANFSIDTLVKMFGYFIESPVWGVFSLVMQPCLGGYLLLSAKANSIFK